jgi:hypothetical protein
MILTLATPTRAAVEPPSAVQITPPRLAYVDGEVLFWRPGEGDWEKAQINMPLAEGDALAAREGKIELQIGAKSFLRAADGTQLRLESIEPGFTRFQMTSGYAVVDLRELRRGVTVQLDTPNGTITLGQDGYYRVDVSDSTRVIVRRGGLATVRPIGGTVADVGTGDAIEMTGTGDGIAPTGTDGAELVAIAAPPFDEWDRWNYDRADRYTSAPRSYAVSDDIYGADELETNGTWRYESPYGRVWVPNSVPAGWAPYTNGRWAYDPLYGWSWVDYAPWGWAPYHYGRWVYNGYWGWAPGPVIAAPFYSPALVAFFGVPGFSVGVGFGVPAVSWVALGWGGAAHPVVGTGRLHRQPVLVGMGRSAHREQRRDQQQHDHQREQRERVPQRERSWCGGRCAEGSFNTHSLDRVRLTNVNTNQLTPLNGKLPVAAKGVTAASGGAPAKLQNPNFGAQQAGGHNGSMPQFNRSGQPAGGSKLAAQGNALGSPGSSPSLGNSKFSNGSAADALRGRGTAQPSANLSKPGSTALGSNNLQRSGQVPPPVPGGTKTFGNSSFDNLRNRGAAPSANGVGNSPALRSTNLQRGTSNPPALPGGSKFGSPTLNQRGASSPPVVSGGSKFGSPTINQRGASSPPSGSGGSKFNSSNFNAVRNPNNGSPGGTFRAPTNMQRSSNTGGSQPPALPRGIAKPGSSTASFQRSRSAPQMNQPQMNQMGRSAPAQNLQRAPSSAPSYPSNVARGGGRPAMPSQQRYGAAAPSGVPSSSARSFSRSAGPITSGGIARGSSSFSRGGGGGISSGAISRGGGFSAGSSMSRGGGMSASPARWAAARWDADRCAGRGGGFAAATPQRSSLSWRRVPYTRRARVDRRRAPPRDRASHACGNAASGIDAAGVTSMARQSRRASARRRRVRWPGLHQSWIFERRTTASSTS